MITDWLGTAVWNGQAHAPRGGNQSFPCLARYVGETFGCPFCLTCVLPSYPTCEDDVASVPAQKTLA